MDISLIPVMEQRQDSVAGQLKDVEMVANRLGMYDAADAIRQLFSTGAIDSVRYGCYCDLEPHMEPDGCVIDDGRYHDCIYAEKGMRKEQCEFWKIVA